MRTIYTITTDSQDLVMYYAADESLVDSMDRYAGDSKPTSEVDRMTQAIWGGTLAAETFLQGSVARDDFKTILRGTLPGSAQRIRGVRPKPNDKERLADDIVLSAPKSVSMALHLEKDRRLFDANLEAVQETLAVIEQELAQTRIQVDGVRQVVHTGKLLAVLMPHHSSRDGDMQLHIHLLIMNGTKAADGIWRSLSHESLSKAEWIGSFYRQRLAEKVQALGYRIYPTEYSFELQGYRRNEIEVFSKRNHAIVEAVKQAELPVNPETKQQQVLPTRKSKTRSGKKLEEIQSLWRAEARSKSVGKPVLDHPICIEPKRETACNAVNQAIQDLSDELVSFSRSDIYAYAHRHIHADGLSLEHINQTIDQHTSLLDAGNGRFTTTAAQVQDLEIRQRWMAGQGNATPWCSDLTLDKTQLNSGQAEVVTRILLSTDSHQIIPHLSDLAKGKALGELISQLEGADVAIRVFSPNSDSAVKFQQTLGFKTNTVEHLISNQLDAARNQLWIFDQAGKISARQMVNIQRQADAVKARILLVGGRKQNSGAVDGSSLRSLINHGATTHSIHLIRWQQRSIQQQAVALIAEGNTKQALDLLQAHGSIREIANAKDRATEIAKQYLALYQKEQNQTVIKTGTSDEELRITQAIRTQLKTEGKLGDSVQTVQLVVRQLTAEQSRNISHYQIGNYIKLRRNYRSTPLKQGQLYKVEAYRGDELVVSSFGGRLFRFNPSQYKDKDVFLAQRLEIAVGDRVRWTYADKRKGQMNGERGAVASIEATSLSLIDLKGKSHEVSLLQPLTIDHDWVAPSTQVQAPKAKQVLLSATGDSTSVQDPLDIHISRKVKDIRVYTEDLQRLSLRIKGASPEITLERRAERSGVHRHCLPQRSVEQTQVVPELRQRNEAQHRSAVENLHVRTSEQERLNQHALELSKRLLRKFGTVQPSGELSWGSGSYTFCANLSRLQVCCHQRGSILELQGGRLTGTVNQADFRRFDSLGKALTQPSVVPTIELD